MPVTVRPAREDDLAAADALVVSSINDLTERHGFGSIARTSPPLFQRFSLEDDPDGLWVAEQDDELAGFALSWTCGQLWFLAQLFVGPGVQAHGVGKELLARTLAHAASREARTKALITFAFNRASQGLYMRHGLYPVAPLYVVGAERAALEEAATEGALRPEPVEPSGAAIARLAAIDAAALGVSRAKHHPYLLEGGGLRAVSLWAGPDCVGYAYAGSDGHVGPVAVSSPEYLPDAFLAGLALARRTSAARVSAMLPGSSPAVLDLALRLGMRIVLPMLLMADRSSWTWDRYLPRNPGVM